MFNPVTTTVLNVLNNETPFAIPVYQRDYKWGTEEAEELFADVESYVGLDGEALFLGNMIFEPGRGGKTFVVDGQQRLTTILLLLIACRMRARELKLGLLEPTIQERIGFKDQTTGESKGSRLLASDSVRDVFDYMANQTWDGVFTPVVIDPTTGQKRQIKRKINKVKPVYETFEKKLRELDAAGLSNFLKSVYSSYIARIEVEDEIEALKVFERTNARGLDLEISDLLKNFLFSRKIDNIEELWDRITENADGTLLRMLKYFYVSKLGYILKPQLYNGLKKYSEKVSPEAFTSQLVAFSEFYRLVKSPDVQKTQEYFLNAGFNNIGGDRDKFEQIAWSLEALHEFGIAQFCPLAFAAIECLARTNGNEDVAGSKKLVELFNTFEKYHFINNAVCEHLGNEIEKVYADTCNNKKDLPSYAASKDFIKTTDSLINELKNKLEQEEVFINRFKRISYESATTLIVYIFDRLNNFGRRPAQSVRIYDPDKRLFRRSFNIEHIFAQKSDGSGKGNQLDAEVLNNIGNLLVLYFRDNSSLGNASTEEKIKRLQGDLANKTQNLTIVADFIRDYGSRASDWNAKAIDDRAGALASKAYKEVWKLR